MAYQISVKRANNPHKWEVIATVKTKRERNTILRKEYPENTLENPKCMIKMRWRTVDK